MNHVQAGNPFSVTLTVCKQQRLQLVVGRSKEARTVPFLVILQVLVVHVQFLFRVQLICKVAFEERTYVTLSLTNS